METSGEFGICRFCRSGSATDCSILPSHEVTVFPPNTNSEIESHLAMDGFQGMSGNPGDFVVTRPVSSNRNRRAMRAINFVGIASCIICTLILLMLTGCRSADTWRETVGNETSQIDRIAHKVDHPVPEIHQVAWSAAPQTLRDRDDLENITYKDLTLDSVLQIAMQNSEVLRRLGGTLLRNPESVHSRFTGPLAVTNPQYSPEAALSAFDAQFRTSAFFSNNDQLYNNPFFAGGTNAFKQDLHEYEAELSKITATGSKIAIRSYSLHNANNAPGNIFRSAWDTYAEGEIRKPLLQGGGLQFNRIAGPGATPGVYNGVLLARVNTDIEQTDFETAVRDYVNDVTNAYWDLYYAYRDLSARSQAMKRALESWNRIKARADSDLESGAAEALAREQYFRFKADVDEAITGRVSLGTRTGSGSTGGTLEGSGGVQINERRLRLLIGMQISDGELLRPSDEPLEADVVFSWDVIQNDALQQRPELRRQQMKVRKREMELLASKNFLNPRLDAVGRYRFRGFGDDLIRSENDASVPSSAVRNMMGGDQQEWFVGFEYEVPIGYRKAHLAVSNAELRLCRERVIFREQQREVIHDLTNAVSDAARAYEACQNNLNRYLAAKEVLRAYEVQDAQDMDIDVDHLLDAQRRVVEAELRYYRARTEYAIALKNVHMEKGSLLTYHNLHIFNNQRHIAAATGDKSNPERSEKAQVAPEQKSHPSRNDAVARSADPAVADKANPERGGNSTVTTASHKSTFTQISAASQANPVRVNARASEEQTSAESKFATKAQSATVNKLRQMESRLRQTAQGPAAQPGRASNPDAEAAGSTVQPQPVAQPEQ